MRRCRPIRRVVSSTTGTPMRRAKSWFSRRPPRMDALALATLLASSSSGIACTCTQTKTTDAMTDASSEAGPPVALAAASRDLGSDELKPIYPADAGPPDPLAIRYCDAVQLLPEKRKAECCAAPLSPPPFGAQQCVRTLTAAIHARAVTLSPLDLDRCLEAVTRATTGCDWVTSSAAPLPLACRGIVRGALLANAPCRSSLECGDGMRCLGLSTIDVGTCGPPKPSGSQCNAAIDTLATYTREDGVDRAHPECSGYCARFRCTDAIPVGGACKLDAQCGGHARCEGGRCTQTPVPVVGEACSIECANGARCFRGECVTPKGEGDACESMAQCRGLCVGADGGVQGACAKSCTTTLLVPASRGRRK
jgi:hypothetical protein